MRFRRSRRADRAYFKRTADNTKVINIRPYLPRGGIRL